MAKKRSGSSSIEQRKKTSLPIPRFSLPDPNRKSHAKRQPPEHIPRPRNAFILFRSNFVEQGKIPRSVEKDHRNISRIIGRIWREMTAEDKQPWVQMAARERTLHHERYPGYRFACRSSQGLKMKPVDDTDAGGMKEKRDVWSHIAFLDHTQSAADLSYVDRLSPTGPGNLGYLAGYDDASVPLRQPQPRRPLGDGDQIPRPRSSSAPYELSQSETIDPCNYRPRGLESAEWALAATPEWYFIDQHYTSPASLKTSDEQQDPRHAYSFAFNNMLIPTLPPLPPYYFTMQDSSHDTPGLIPELDVTASAISRSYSDLSPGSLQDQESSGSSSGYEYMHGL